MTDTIPSKRLLRRPEVEKLTGLSRSTLYLRISHYTFPKPVPLGGRIVGWLESDIFQWIDDCVANANDTA